jgi:VWFA-related protein
MKKALLLIVVSGLLLSLPSFGAPRPAEDTTSRAVQVDVIVTKDKEPVKDLAQSDFKLFEDGKEVPINSFAFEESRPETPGSADKRLVVIYHDTSYWDMNLKPQVAEITDELVKLSRQGIEIMVFKMNWTEDLKILQPFTAQEDLIRKAAETATQTIGGDQIHDNVLLGNVLPDQPTSGTAPDQDRGERQAYRTIGRQRFEKALGGLLTVCNMIQNTPGRKSVLLISNGIPDLSSSSSSGILDSDKTGREMLDAIHTRDNEEYGKVRIFDPFGIMKNKEFNTAEDVLKELIRFANTNGISIYALDPGVFSQSSKTGSSEYRLASDSVGRTFVEEEKSKQLQNLRLIAEETNAALFRGSDKYTQMNAVLNGDLNAHYLLSFIPKRKKADGEYHEIAVKLDRKDADIRARKGYRDDTAEDIERNRLVSAYYAPDLFKQLPFFGEFLPFSTGKGKAQLWMSIALPTKDIFLQDEVSGPVTLDLNFWMKKDGDKAFGGKITLPFSVDEAFLDNVRKRAFLWYFFSGSELDLEPGHYQAVYALVNRESGKIGTWHAPFVVPELGKGPNPVFLNCVLGAVAENPDKQREVFALDRNSGEMEYGGLKFFPQVTNRFSARQSDLYVFMQVYDPSGTGTFKPEYIISGPAGSSATLEGETVAESWNKKSKVWSGICKIDFSSVAVADHVFQGAVTGPGGDLVLSPEIRFVKLAF